MESQYTTGHNGRTHFGFDYDVLNHFEKAWYATNNNQGTWTGNASFDEAVQSYDKNGNIQGIERHGKCTGDNRTNWQHLLWL